VLLLHRQGDQGKDTSSRVTWHSKHDKPQGIDLGLVRHDSITHQHPDQSMLSCCLQSVLGICRTLFLVILLALGANFIHKDTRRLVLLPVERMVTRVKDMAEDPLRQGTMPRVSRSMPDPTASADAAWAEATKASAALTAVRAACRMVAGPRTAAHLSSPAPGAESEMGDSVATSALVSRKQSFAGNNLGGSQMSDASGFVTSDVLGVHHRSCPSPGLPGYEAGDSDSSPSRALRSVKSRRGSWAVYGPQGGPNLAAAVPRLQAAAKKPTTKLRKASHAAGSAVMKVRGMVDHVVCRLCCV
jgi:hypothetical protein